MYHYKVKSIERVLDGDTVDTIIDLGFNISVKKRIRFYNVNAPEVRTRNKSIKKLGIESKIFLQNLLDSESTIYLKSFGLGKYGRVIGELFLDKNMEKSVNSIMIAEGHLHKKTY